MKIRLGSVLLASLLVIVGGCDSVDSTAGDTIEPEPFTGQWIEWTKYADERNPVVKETVDVVTDGHRFRVFRETDDRFSLPDRLVVYDGAYVSKNGHLSHRTYDSPEYLTHAFWLYRRAEKTRKSRKVCGRKTDRWRLAYEEDGFKYTSEYWADRETGMVIETIETTTKLATGAMVYRRILECQWISFGPVDDSAFEHPPETPLN
jgi:hypothetical protein